MASRMPVRIAQRLSAAQLDRVASVSLVLGKAVQKVIRSKRAILATKVKLAAMRGKSKGIR